MQSKNTCGSVSILGGSYKEYDITAGIEPQTWGSGIRALSLFRELNMDSSILKFYTCCSQSTDREMRIAPKWKDVNINTAESQDVMFIYHHPFHLAGTSPRLDQIYASRKHIEVQDDCVLVFGMVDATFKVKGNRVVYDPQTTTLPARFSQTGSQAKELVYILNEEEAREISGTNTLKEFRDFFFSSEPNCKALIVKMGYKGAYLCIQGDNNDYYIPVYMTNLVHAIGTGDIFSSSFAYYWFNGASFIEAANIASRMVACYSDTGKISGIRQGLSQFGYLPIDWADTVGQIYIAAPFFSNAQRWLVNEFKNALDSVGIKVFSPMHQVGICTNYSPEVVKKDIQGLEESNVILALLDGLDSGTLFEVGYAIAKGKKVVGYIEKETENSLFMLKGMDCEIVNDIATAIYKATWYATKR